ncbi:MAG: hypothetical protein ACI9RU_001638 [Litorivivens sp.]|jgi:hypothetical protein
MDFCQLWLQVPVTTVRARLQRVRLFNSINTFKYPIPRSCAFATRSVCYPFLKTGNRYPKFVKLCSISGNAISIVFRAFKLS